MAMKKIISGALAAMMALSISATAFATDADPTPTPVKPIAETTESSFQVELEGMIYTPTIRVQVTEAGNVYVNPTGSTIAGTMTKALDGTTNLDYSFACATGSSTKTIKAGVASTPVLIRSDTDQKLDVYATATATVPKTSGITLVAADPASATAADGKQVYLYVGGNKNGLGDSSGLKTVVDPDDNSVTPGLTETNAGLYGTGAQKVDLDDIGTDKKTASTTSSGKVTSIDAATQNKDAAGKVLTAVPQYGAVVVGGMVNPNATGWGESDVVNVSVALTFAIA